jgi:anaerobic selenocysteine-containing dehydrogenase
MQLDRRNFIKFLVGGVAGIHATPLPWKLTDDIAIWTQNWPWVPVPPTGEFSEVKSVCGLCPGGCGIAVRKVAERAVKIEGRTDYPVNPGGICPVGMGALQLLYNRDTRFTGPMKRVGPRGSGEFTPITWSEALDMLARRLNKLRAAGKPEALAAFDGNRMQSTMSELIRRLLEAVGSPNYLRVPSLEDTYAMTLGRMQGTHGPMAYDLENADYVLSFGAGLLEGWGAPGRVLNAWNLWHQAGGKRNPKIVQIESRASNTASKADQWVALRPGTEALLALAMAHVIIRDEIYARRFVDRHCADFGSFRELVLQKCAPRRIARLTGLDPAAIVSLARSFAEADAPLALYGKGKGALNGSLHECMAVHALNALVGNINQPGGVLVHEPLPLRDLPAAEPDAIARRGMRRPRLDNAGGSDYPYAQSLPNEFARNVRETPHGSPVDTLLCFATNPAFTLPDAGAFRKALERIPFVVSFSPFRDETAFMADLVLPDHTFLEKSEEIVWPPGLQYPLYGLSKPVVEPVCNTRHSGDALLRLARKMGAPIAGAFPWKRYADVVKVRVRGLFAAGNGRIHYDSAEPVWRRQPKGSADRPDYASFEEMWRKLKAAGCWYRSTHGYEQWQKLFKTPSGKFEFAAGRIEQGLRTGLRQATAKHSSLLMAPYEMINLGSTGVPSPPFLNKTLFATQLRKDESFLEINPQTAAKYGLQEGDRVLLKSAAGQIRVRVTLFEGAGPGVVYLPLGLGHTAYDEFWRGKGANPNQIIQADKDPLSGHPVWWNTPVKLTKV